MTNSHYNLELFSFSTCLLGYVVSIRAIMRLASPVLASGGLDSVQIGEFSLTNFRNYRRFETKLPSGPVILVGRNAQGKTSLLEAIYYLAAANSPHAGSDRQLINWLALREEEHPFLKIVAEVLLSDEKRKVDVRLELQAAGLGREQRVKKTVLINGIKRQVKDLHGAVNLVMFLPRDMMLVEGSPGDRRRFLDATISQIDSDYAAAVREYGKVLTQRNALLKTLRARKGVDSQIAYWDEVLCEQGAKIITRRSRALKEIEQYAGDVQKYLTEEREYLQLVYCPSYGQGEQLELGLGVRSNYVDNPESELAAGMRSKLRDTLSDDVRRGMTLVGPHRDDFRFVLTGVDLGQFGSRGQARTAVLALKLAEMSWMRDRIGEWPLLLLDEVLAELDPQRRQELLRRISEVDQVLLTTADIDMVDAKFREQASVWRIDAGTVHPETPMQTDGFLG